MTTVVVNMNVDCFKEVAVLHTSRQVFWKGIVIAGSLILASPVAVLWAWNISLVRLAGVPALDYRGALGLVILLLAVTAVVRISGRGRLRVSR